MISIYGLWDRKAGKFLSTFTETNNETAIRNFKAIRSDKNTIIGMFPEDYELWKLGEMDQHTGITNIEKEYIDGGAVVNG